MLRVLGVSLLTSLALSSFGNVATTLAALPATLTPMRVASSDAAGPGRPSASSPASSVGADGKTFEQRRQEWLDRDGATLIDHEVPCDEVWVNWGGERFISLQESCVQVFAWIEKGTHTDCSQPLANIDDDPNPEYACVSSVIDYLFGAVSTSGSGAALRLTRLLYGYGDRLSPNDRGKISGYFADQIRSPYLFARLGGDTQPQQTVARYLHSLDDRDVRIRWSECLYYRDPGNPRAIEDGWVENPSGNPDDVPADKRMTCADATYGWSFAFSYDGRAYIPGYTYNSYEISRDMLYRILDEYVTPGTYEHDSMVYTILALSALRELHDFADRPLQRLGGQPDPEGVEMSRRAKMVLDLMLLDEVDDFSANQRGGHMGRSYRDQAISGNDGSCVYEYWGRMDNRYWMASCDEAFASSYRPPDVLTDIATIDKESAGYWHLVRENNRASWLPAQQGKWNFVTRFFNLGGSTVGRWQLNLLSTDGSGYRVGVPFKLWINDDPGDADTKACPPGECYNEMGEAGFQYRNAMLIEVADPIVHFTPGADRFDEGGENLAAFGQYQRDYRLASGGWKFFREGRVGLAMLVSGPRMALEVVALAPGCGEDFCYPSMDAFRQAVETNARLGDGWFITSRGKRIGHRSLGDFEAATVDGQDVFTFRFPRLAIDSSFGPLATWDNRIWTVSKNGASCTYDFNSWTFSGACGEASGTTFADVPRSHPFYASIEALYQHGLTAGCRAQPLLFCPDQPMTRAQSAVFLERGHHTADYLPADPSAPHFSDTPLPAWFTNWVEGLWLDGYTSGCGLNPPRYCPDGVHNRVEGAVFAMRMKGGPSYQPTPAQGLFADLPGTEWGAKWAEAAYNAGLIEPCGEAPLRFCPDDPVTRGLAASIIVRAKGLGR